MHKLIEDISQDCHTHGWGRKKWWSQTLGISPVTLSYWLGGTRKPTVKQLEKAESIFSVLGDRENSAVWLDHLYSI